MKKNEKQKLLAAIEDKIARCRMCQKDTVGVAVAGEGNPNAAIVFVGEAPGKQEAKTGRPFVGRSGKLLRQLIKDVGVEEKDIYITSPVKYLPKRGTPTSVQIIHGKAHLFQQLHVINPKVVVLLGRVACQAVLEMNVPILTEHGKIIKKEGRIYLVTLHPAAVLRFSKYKEMIIEDLNKLKELAN